MTESGRKKKKARVMAQTQIAPGIYDLRLRWEDAKLARPGQFVMVYPECAATLLPRPISICETDPEGAQLRLVYRVAGAGTKEFSALGPGEEVSILGPIGNGYDLTGLSGKEVLLLGGGIGIPPMLELAKTLEGKARSVTAVLGYRDDHLFLAADLEDYAQVLVATEDGSLGTKGNVLDAIRVNEVTADAVCACGPMPMLRAIKEYALGLDIPAYLSLEERMACGVGACLGCVTKTAKEDPHSHVNNARVCTEGPVFECREVLL
ncbi:MAG: dihydroorotate dehydrogenase electron transfer subunit [Lachnospiraceae bacterium]|nr:dihydroorotate dehydrogenase electron transfer subunit [Lachnospiraceae bacterium]